MYMPGNEENDMKLETSIILKIDYVSIKIFLI